jgi:hypothetical protein
VIATGLDPAGYGLGFSFDSGDGDGDGEGVGVVEAGPSAGIAAVHR